VRPRRQLQALVFDFDGTLATLTIDFRGMKEELLALAREVLPGIAAAGDTPALEWLDSLFVHQPGIAPGDAQALRNRLECRIVDIEVAAAQCGALFDFVRPMLTRLRGKGVRTAIITRNCSKALYQVFPDAAELTDGVFTRDDVHRVKPDPGHLLAALEALGVSPGRAAMVGDHVSDIRTGKRAGTLTVGVLTGSSSRRDLLGAGADLVADDGRGAAQALLEWPGRD